MMNELISNHFYEFLLLAGTHLLAVASPGPDFAIVTKHTINYGKKTGHMTALGVGTAILLHVAYALLGFSLLVKTNEQLYTVITWIGALFLIYLGVMSLRAKNTTTATKDTQKTSLSNKKAFATGFLTNALNIKALLFFLFLFTSLVDVDTPLSVKLFYGGWLSFSTFAWFYFVASVFGMQAVRQFFTRFGVWFDRAMGILLIVLALFVLF